MVQLIFAVVEILVIVDVHDKGFACPGCHPEGEFFDICFCEVGILGVARCFPYIFGLDECIELMEEFRGAIEFPIQKNSV